MSVDNWINFWKSHSGTGYHEEDLDIANSWPKFDTTPDFSLTSKYPRNFHPLLFPMPYVGNLKEATLILAMLNPTVGPYDYQDQSTEKFRLLAEAHRKQQDVTGCFAVDDTCGIRSWFEYYRSIFRSAVVKTAEESKCMEDVVWAELIRRLAIVELVPYYSKTADELIKSDRYLGLRSVMLALDAMKEIQKRPGVKILCRWRRGPERWRLDRGSCVLLSTRQGMDAAAKDAVCKHLTGFLHPHAKTEERPAPLEIE